MKQPQEVTTHTLSLAHIKELCAQLSLSIPVEEQEEFLNLLHILIIENYPDDWHAKDLKKCLFFLEFIPVLLRHCDKLD
jgi:hypothetical protein